MREAALPARAQSREQRPAGLSHICCAPPPRAPTSFSRRPLLAKTRPQGRGQLQGGGPQGLPELSADESSGYESESAASGLPWPQPLKVRTAFTAEQLCRLEGAFQRYKYLGAAERRKLAAALQLSEVQVKTWFQNRRMKLKRQIQDYHHSLLSSDPFCSYKQGPLPNMFQDYSHYLGPQQLLPFAPNSALHFNSSFQIYDAQNTPYLLTAHDLPFYHQHFLSQLYPSNYTEQNGHQTV